MKQSRYSILVPLVGGRALAHNTLSGATALLTQEELAVLERPDRSDMVQRASHLKNLSYGGFLVSEEADEFDLLKREFARQRVDTKGMVLTIAPTLNCNFACDYCYQGQAKPIAKMSEAVQDAILDLVKDNASTLKRLHVAWYGGEPLLALAIIESLSDRLIETCKRHSIAYSAMMVTNGYKLNASVAKSLHSRRVEFAQVTLDGAAKYHDCRRTTLGGLGTFDRIVNNLWDVITNSSLRIDARINIDWRNANDIATLLDYLAQRGFSKRKNFSVYFAPVEAITEGCHSVSSCCMPKSDYAKLETSLHRRAYELGLAALPYPRRFRGLCSAVRPRGFVVNPIGEVHKCWDTVSFPHLSVGSVFDRKSLASDVRVKEWMEWTPFESASCKECKLLPSCTGSCAHKFVNADQTRGEAASLPCPSWKYQIKERLLLFAVKNGMIRPDEFKPEDVVTDPAEICPEIDSALHSRELGRNDRLMLRSISLVHLSPHGQKDALHC